jgi:hypothetical protein
MEEGSNRSATYTDERRSTMGVVDSLTRNHTTQPGTSLVSKVWLSRFVGFAAAFIAFVPVFLSVSLIVLFVEHSLFGPWLPNETLLWSFGFAILASCCAAWMTYRVVKRWIMKRRYETRTA